ncbi:glycoside hydrolase family 3 protein [Micromonospora endophytica]|uniref:beta-N-acetylhexosaminidase n=1 Tax=Micromonospora endophytica TaxID=515350 RepID=A0A2W2CS66_9ACTN|nr:glycoside hydrolase family 3 protein [Micromonospora endophytica]PZG00721.1 beta-N-acetylhexosaminidase [Micromonospora endophytica]RIW44842.1 glycoside hydrolase family 3 protein [Micromonospora endophytica]BCJ57571.1 beta-N-acetylhexosaminidase [Micromonospora endophytica]
MFRRIGSALRVPVVLVVACGLMLSAGGSAGVGSTPERSAYRGDGGPPAGHQPDQRVRAVMARMTLAEKVGQMFVLQVYGDTATTTNPTDVAANQALYGSDIRNGAQLLRKYHPGGIIYFTASNNLNNPQQVALLSNGLQKAALADKGVPVQISTDQEGGFVTRIPPPSAISPGNMAIGATFDRGLSYSTAAATSRQLRAMGINMDHAPVVDVNTNPRNTADGTRSFGDRTRPVSAFGAAAVTGYQQSGRVAATAKHFPGLGSAEANPDTGIAVVDESREEILRTDIPPFRAAIEAGVKSIMPTAVIVPALDPTRTPALLSKPIITGLLRDKLKYDGVVITDALRASALASIPQEQVILDAVNAGNDELLLPTDPPAAIATVLDAVRDGTISRHRIDQSVYRILRMKAELGLFDDPFTTSEAVDSFVGTAADQQTMSVAAHRSMTLLRNRNQVLPLAAQSGQHLLVTGWGVNAVPGLASQLSSKGLVATPMWTGSPDSQTIKQVVAAARASDVTVVITNNAWNDVTQQNLVKALLATKKPIVTVAVGGPYDIAYFPSAPTYLAAYGYRDVSLAAIADTIVGAEPTGRLPVTIRTPDGTKVLFRYGSGIGYRTDAP